MVAHGGLFGEHDAVGAVQHRIGHVRGLGAGGLGGVHHGEQHLRGHDDGLGGLVAGLDDVLLDGGQLGQRALHAEIAAGHHDDVRLGQDLGEVVHRVLALHLHAHRHVLAAGVDELLGLAHVVGRLHVGDGHGVDAETHAVLEVALVLVREGAHARGLAGQGQALAGGHDAGIGRLQHDEAVVADLGNVELHAAVGEHEPVARHQRGEYLLVVEGHVGHLVAVLLRGAEQESHALADLDARFPDVAEAYLRSREILHDGQGDAEFQLHVPEVLDDADEVLGRAVGEVQPEDAHAGLGQGAHLFLSVGGRAYGGHDFRLAHCRKSRFCWGRGLAAATAGVCLAGQENMPFPPLWLSLCGPAARALNLHGPAGAAPGPAGAPPS